MRGGPRFLPLEQSGMAVGARGGSAGCWAAGLGAPRLRWGGARVAPPPLRGRPRGGARCPSSARGIPNFHAGRGVCFVAGHFVLVFVFISHLLKGKLDKRILLDFLIVIIFFQYKNASVCIISPTVHPVPSLLFVLLALLYMAVYFCCCCSQPYCLSQS